MKYFNAPAWWTDAGSHALIKIYFDSHFLFLEGIGRDEPPYILRFENSIKGNERINKFTS